MHPFPLMLPLMLTSITASRSPPQSTPLSELDSSASLTSSHGVEAEEQSANVSTPTSINVSSSSTQKHSGAKDSELNSEKKCFGPDTKKGNTYHNCTFNITQTSENPLIPNPGQYIPSPTQKQYIPTTFPMNCNYSHVQPLPIPLNRTSNMNTDVWGGIPDSAFANLNSNIKLTQTGVPGIRGIQQNPYSTRNSNAGVHHRPPAHNRHMEYYQNPTAYQSPPQLRQTIPIPYPPTPPTTTIQVIVPQLQPHGESTARRLSPDYYGTINDDAFLTMHIPEPQTNHRHVNIQHRNPYKK